MFGGQMGVVAELRAMVQKTYRLTLEIHRCLSLDLSCTQTHRTEQTRPFSISPAPEGYLRLILTPTLPTLSILGIHIMDAS